MSETRQKRKVEFIESYWTGGEYGSNYQWNDNHGELVRCRDCRYYNNNAEQKKAGKWLPCMVPIKDGDWYCADGERRRSGNDQQRSY